MNKCVAFLTLSFLILAVSSGFGQSNIVIISGGPAVYNSKDSQHDKSWANYVTSPGLLYKNGKIKPLQNQEVWWFVYKPAYVKRWNDDLKAKDHRQKSVKDVKDAGYASYVDLIEKKAKSRNWKLRWISSSSDLWKKLATFQHPVDKLYYWGHAKGDLWLTCTHDNSNQATKPEKSAVISLSEIAENKTLAERFVAGKQQPCEFWGCNTAKFAEQWASSMKTKSFGFNGKVDFGDIFSTTDGNPSYSKLAKKDFP